MELTVQKRETFGKANKALRKEGFIPAEVYGSGVENLHISVNAKDFVRLFKEAGESTIVYLVIDGEKQPVLIQDTQQDRLTQDVTHIDFYKVKMDEEITATIPWRAEVLWSPSTSSGRLLKPQVLIIGCGPLLYNALLVARELEKKKIGVIVLNVHTIKPLDEKKIIELARKTGAVVTVEEHSVIGGLGGAVAELLARHRPVPMEFIGMQDTFGESGKATELIKKYGMDVADIVGAVKKVMRRK